MTVQERNLLGSTLTPTGLDIPPDIGVEEWTELGKHLGIGIDAFKWAIGDWIVFGDRAFGENRVNQAAEVTKRSPSTLNKYRWVASSFPRHRRRELSFTHHEIVAALPLEIADGWLDEAEAHDWNSNELRGHVRPDKEPLACTCVADPACPKHGDPNA